MTIQDIVGENEKIVVAWTISGTHDGEFMGIPATHKKVSADGIANRLDGF
jgi:predicted ester cyclase